MTWWVLPPAIFRTDGIVVVSFKKTDLDRQMEAWTKEEKCTCLMCTRNRELRGEL